MTNPGLRELWVCWTRPSVLPKNNAAILSFLPPADETEVRRTWTGEFLSAREIPSHVRCEARDFYIKLVARIGLIKTRSGQTLRSRLAPVGRCSRWWFHAVSFKDCESDPTFNWIIAISLIRFVASRRSIRQLILVGAPEVISLVLETGFTVSSWDAGPAATLWPHLVRSILARAVYVWKTLRNCAVSRRYAPGQSLGYDAAFSGFWDWSVSWNEETQAVRDSYFVDLPDRMQGRGYSVGWFVWLDPKSRQPLQSVLAPLRDQHSVVILQSFLNMADVLRSFFRFDFLFTIIENYDEREFRENFVCDGLNYFPIFKTRMFSGFLDYRLLECEIVSLAMERACRQYSPKLLFSFLEHFPFARAQYEGSRRGSDHTLNVAVQHASYCRQKTFLFLDSESEFRGEPDNQPVPHANFVCAMGDFSVELFAECGYTPEMIIPTGSPRYGGLRVFIPEVAPPSGSHALRILVPAAMDAGPELELLEAISEATIGLKDITVVLRNHPLARLSDLPEFDPYRQRVKVTSQSLETDLKEADLIVFTYSTVAEEAFVRGKPVWQWLPLGYNGSALAELGFAQQFASAADLRSAIQAFQLNRSPFLPASADCQIVMRKLFHAADGKAAERIAQLCEQWLEGSKSQAMRTNRRN